MLSGRGMAVALALVMLSLANAPAMDEWPDASALPPQPALAACCMDDAAPGDASRIKIFVTNDVHGYVFEDESRKRIGYALLQGHIEAARREGWQTLLMDAGDAFSGNTLAQFDAGLDVAELMGRMGYRVVAPGNHAFDYNAATGNMRYYSDILLEKAAASSSGPFEATCVNLAFAGGPLPRLTREPIVLIDDGGFRLVVLGVLTPYARSKSNPENTEGSYGFGLVEKDGLPDHAATKARLLEEVARALAPYDRPGDVVVLLSHVGAGDSEDYAHGQVRGDDLASVPNVDFVADAHSHQHVPAERIGGAFYGNGGRYLEQFAEITLIREGDAVAGHMEYRDYDDVKGATEPSAAMLARLREMSDRMGLGDELFFVREDYLDDEDADRESKPLGRFLCKSLNAMSGADLSIFNSGSIRSGLAPGWVTLGTLYDMIPFQNNVVTFTMTGDAILGFFRDMPLRRTNPFPQFYGMSVYAWERGAGLPLGIAGVRDESGAPLDPGRKYTVAINSFMAEGGDGYAFTLTDKRVLGDYMALFVRYLKETGSPDFESVRENRTLMVYPTREEAEDAFRADEEVRGAA